MTFASLEFGIFFILIFVLYFWVFKRHQNILLLIGSYFFYGWWDWRFLSLILFSTIVDFYCAKRIAASHDKGGRKYLLISILVNLGVLGFFKYFNFFIQSFSDALGSFGFQSNIGTLSIILPLGISFYTFQTMAYTIDVFRGNVSHTNKFIDFALYVTYFPQLVAGPIERAQRIFPQIQSERRFHIDSIRSGLLLILVGLVRKIVIADNAAIYVNEAFQMSATLSSMDILLLGLFFALQIYGDFAGYTDIARGTSRILGVELMENFNAPYFSTNITEFWHRWHISLSTWLRDYLYIPLGGNRGSVLFKYRNLMLTMILGGLWHGASWKFVIWGFIHGLALVVHKIWFSSKVGKKVRLIKGFKPVFGLVGWFLTMLVVILAWLFFAAPDTNTAFLILQNFLYHHAGGISLDLGVWFALLFLLLLIDVPQQIGKDHTIFMRWPPLIKSAIYVFFLLLILMYGSKASEPFIYFQF